MSGRPGPRARPPPRERRCDAALLAHPAPVGSYRLLDLTRFAEEEALGLRHAEAEERLPPLSTTSLTPPGPS